MGTTNMDRPAWNCRSTKVYRERERGEVTSGSVKMIKIHNAPTFRYFFRFGEPSIDDTKVCTCIYM